MKGKLIIFEGMDGSGKTTLVRSLAEQLQQDGYQIAVTSWGSSSLMGDYMNRLWKHGQKVTDRALSCLYAADLLIRLKENILPELEKGTIVLCDRYYYTQLVRDYAVGLDPQWSRMLFQGCPDPDMIFYIDVSVLTSRTRVQQRMDNVQQNNKTDLSGSLLGSLMMQHNAMLYQRYRPDGEPMSEEDREATIQQYQHAVLQEYNNLFPPRSSAIHIDGEKTSPVVFSTVYSILCDYLKIGKKPPALL